MQRDALLAAIMESPDEDGPRLVYADWLEENGDEADQARARFIRLQCRIAALERLSPERMELELEEEGLLAAHGEAWRKGVPAWARPHGANMLRRGFVERASMTPALLLGCGAELFRRHPIRSLGLLGDESAPDWSASPHLARVREMHLAGAHDPEVLRHAIESGALRGVRRLGVPVGVLRDRGARRWPALTADNLPGLEHLELALPGPELVGPVREFLSVERPFHLDQLVLMGGRHYADDLVPLLEAKEAVGLSALVLGGLEGIGEGVRDLVRAIRSPLRELWLYDSVVASGVAHLAHSPGLARLRSLGLVRAHLGPKGLVAVANSEHLANLTILDVIESGLADESAHALAASTTLTSLRKLHLRRGGISDDGLAALAASPLMRQLTHFEVGWRMIEGPGVAALAASPNVANLRRLSLWGCEIGPEAAEAIAHSPHLANLRSLDLSHTRVGKGAQAFVESPSMANLRYLGLDRCRVPSATKKALRERFGKGVQL